MFVVTKEIFLKIENENSPNSTCKYTLLFSTRFLGVFTSRQTEAARKEYINNGLIKLKQKQFSKRKFLPYCFRNQTKSFSVIEDDRNLI